MSCYETEAWKQYMISRANLDAAATKLLSRQADEDADYALELYIGEFITSDELMKLIYSKRIDETKTITPEDKNLILAYGEERAMLAISNYEMYVNRQR